MAAPLARRGATASPTVRRRWTLVCHAAGAAVRFIRNQMDIVSSSVFFHWASDGNFYGRTALNECSFEAILSIYVIHVRTLSDSHVIHNTILLCVLFHLF